MSQSRSRLRRLLVTCMCLTCALVTLAYTIQEGCPDFMDLTQPYVEGFTGSFDSPFEENGISPERHVRFTQRETDEHTGGKLPTIPNGELTSIRLGNDQVGGEAEAIVYHFTVDPANTLLFVNFAVVMEDPGHDKIYQPRFVVRITDAVGNLVNDCSEYDVSAAFGIPGFQDYLDGYTAVRWRDWTKVGLDLTPFAGQEVQVQFITYDCALMGHFGYAYFTAHCAPNRLDVVNCSGSTVSVSAPEGFESYLWDNGDTTRVTVREVKSEGEHIYCEVTSVTGCSFTQSAYLTSSDAGLETFFVDTICQGEPYQKHNYNLPPQQNVGTTLFSNVIVNPTQCSESLETQLQLTVLQQFYPIEKSICQGEDYEENGFSIIQPPVGILFDTLRFTRDGRCDSVVCLKLNINESLDLPNSLIGDASPCTGVPTSYYIDADNSATSYQWTLPENAVLMSGGNSPQVQLYFTDDKPVTLLLRGENGCGTGGVPLEIRPRMSYHQFITDTACVGEYYQKNNFNVGLLTETGYYTYTQSLKSATGCDSVVVLALHVFQPPTVNIVVEGDRTILCSSERVALRAEGSSGGYVVHGCDSLPVAVGDVYCADGSTMHLKEFLASSKRAEGVVFYIDPAYEYALVADTKDLFQDRYASWSVWSYDIPTIPNYTKVRQVLEDVEGYAHTAIMRMEGDETRFPLAWYVDFENGWYVPAAGEMRLLFSMIKEVNETLSQIGGQEMPSHTNGRMDEYTYFCSTEHSASYFCAMIETGRINGFYKGSTLGSLRQIRSVKLNVMQKPKVKLGDLVENEYGEKGIAFHLNEDGRTGWMVALEDADSLLMWATSSYDVEKLPNQGDGSYFTSYSMAANDLAGKENTQLIQQEGDRTRFPAAWEANGAKGWFLPSVGQMSELYALSTLMDSSLTNAGGYEIEYDNYWTSSELDSAYSWSYDMAFGNPEPLKKDIELYVRCVSEFSLCEPYVEVLDSSLTYQWSTGEESPYIEVSPQTTSSYTVVASNAEGCRASSTKQLVVTKQDTTVIDTMICFGEVYRDEFFEVSQSGSYTRLVETDRCQQVMVLNLKVAQQQQVVDMEDETCQGVAYQKNGFLLPANLPGVYRDTLRLQNETGCDSVVALRLTVSDMLRDTIYQRICQNESYFENGFEIAAYQSVGEHIYEKKMTQTNGCLSVRTLVLQVDSVYQLSMVDEGCQDRNYHSNGFDVTPDEPGANFYSLTLQSQTGCDSVISLRLMTHPSYQTVIEDTVSTGMTYEKYGFALTERTQIGLENHRLEKYVEATGCDSIIELHLTVLDDASTTFVPTAFSPYNENGANDIFMPGYELYIYDRYGLLVCHSADGWDGKYRGTWADPGVYIYTLRFKSGKEKHGTVEVLRP